MNDTERCNLVRVYSTWEDSALLTALTTGRSQYRPEVLPLIEAEVQKRSLTVPALVADVPRPASRCTVLTTVAPPVEALPARKRLSWIGKGYIVIGVWMVFPVVPALVTAPFEQVLGWKWNEGNSPVHTFGLLMFLTVPTGLMAIVGLTIAVLVAKWRERRG